MKDSIRQILMFGAVIAGGLIIFFIDIPLFYLMVALVVIIAALLITSGVIPFGRFRPKKEGKTDKKIQETTPVKKEAAKGKPEKGKTEKSKGSARGIGETVSLVKKGLFSFVGNIRKGKEKTSPGQVLKGTPKKARVSEQKARSALSEVPQMATPAASKPDADPLLPLVNEEIDTDLLDSVSLDDDVSLLNEINPELDSPAVSERDIEKLDITIDDEESTITLDEDNTDEVKDILDQNVDEISNTIDQNGGGTDLDSISLDSGGKQKPAAAGSAGEPSPSWMSSSPLDDDTGEEGEKGDEFSFGGEGGSDEDDLLASLKSDIQSIKKNDEDSLVRDLKDLKVPAADLEQELTSVIEMMNKTGG